MKLYYEATVIKCMVLEQNRAQGFPWQVSILNSMLPLWGQGVVQSLVGELGSHMPCGVAHTQKKPRNKPILIWSINLQQKRQENTVRKRQINDVKKTRQLLQKNETGPLYNIKYKNKLKMD